MKTPRTLIFTAIVTALLEANLAWSDVCSDAEVAYFYNDEVEENKAWMSYVAAPSKMIGGNVEHWFPHLLPDYQWVYVEGMKSRHWKQPAILFEIRDELTSINFEVNLVTNQHSLQKVETSSKTLLKTLGIPWEELGESKPKVWCVCGDATCDSFSFRKSDNGDFVGTWTKEWD